MLTFPTVVLRTLRQNSLALLCSSAVLPVGRPALRIHDGQEKGKEGKGIMKSFPQTESRFSVIDFLIRK